MKLRLLITLLVTLSVSSVFSQDTQTRTIPTTPSWALKSNLLLDATTSFSLGFETKIGRRLTLDVPVSYNPWTFPENRKWKHIFTQPEVRYWLCEPFYGHFLGAHAHYAFYNVGRLPFGELRDHRYEGWLVGAGVSYGYHWMLGSNWSLEASLGLGYAYLDYEKFECYYCGDKLKDGKRHYFGATKVALSLIYIIK